jgi:hypothetical protein
VSDIPGYTEAVQAAARAVAGTFGWPDEAITEELVGRYRRYGDAALAAALPFLERALRDKIAAESRRSLWYCDDCGHDHQGAGSAFICIGCPCPNTGGTAAMTETHEHHWTGWWPSAVSSGGAVAWERRQCVTCRLTQDRPVARGGEATQ